MPIHTTFSMPLRSITKHIGIRICLARSERHLFTVSAEVASGCGSVQMAYPWPNADRPGVYFIFGQNMELLYVGKASWLGRRLGDYFKWLAGRGKWVQDRAQRMEDAPHLSRDGGIE